MRKRINTNYLLYIALCFPVFLFSQIKFTQVKSGLGVVTDITHAGDGGKRIFVANKNGVVTILDSAFITLGTLLNISTLISTASEKGLLGLAFHPDFKTNGYFFVNYNPTGTNHTRISRFTATNPASNTSVNLTSEKTIITITNAAAQNHKGGDLAFGPDGYLYFGTGDGGGGGDPQGSGQDGNSLLGKIIRLDINTTNAYNIPASNPFVGNPSILDEIWDYGIRNPWRISFDRQSGNLWIADVGQNAREEINVETPGSGGKNYGWNCREGFAGFNTSCQGNTGFTDPIFEYLHCSPCNTAGFGNSITGGFVYRGNKHANNGLKGYYIFADYISLHAWIIKQIPATAFAPSNAALDVRTIGNLTTSGITSFGELENGEILAGLANGVLGAIDATASLPIRSIQLEGSRVNKTILLNWDVSGESEIEQYDVEKSTDGEVFTSLDPGIKAKNNTLLTSQYSFIDYHAAPGKNYYRIKIVHFNHTIDYSDVVLMKGWAAPGEFIYNSRNKELYCNSVRNISKPLFIYNYQGQLVKQIQYSGIPIDLSDLSHGVYILKFNDINGPQVQKIPIY